MIAVTADRSEPRYRNLRLQLLTWAFTFFNSVRLLAYLPTIVAMSIEGDASQHSLWTWITWTSANATMALWLREQNGGHLDKTVAVNLGNASMCAVTTLMIVWYRI